MLEGFTRTQIKTSGARISTVHGGAGPPLLLMHGNPFSHLSWHKIAPALAREFTVVATDLRGYGDSEKPPGGDDHSGYSFRAMAQDQIEVMAALGYQRFYATVHATCEAYRATHGVDLAMDEEDFAKSRKIASPLLLLWGATGGVGRNQKPMEIWPRYASNIVAGKALPCGHYLTDEAPQETC